MQTCWLHRWVTQHDMHTVATQAPWPNIFASIYFTQSVCLCRRLRPEFSFAVEPSPSGGKPCHGVELVLGWCWTTGKPTTICVRLSHSRFHIHICLLFPGGCLVINRTLPYTAQMRYQVIFKFFVRLQAQLIHICSALFLEIVSCAHVIWPPTNTGASIM